MEKSSTGSTKTVPVQSEEALDHVQDVAHFFFFCPEIIDIGFAGRNFQRDTIDDFEAIPCKADELTRIVGYQPKFFHSQ